jgi:hypothetical protein
MITPEELFSKADKMFNRVVSLNLLGEPIFPLVIPSNKKLTGTNFNQLRKDLVPLYKGSKAFIGSGYSVDWREKKINGSAQSVPTRIYFETLQDFMSFLNRQDDYDKIETCRYEILSKFPTLNKWTCENPSIILEYSTEWSEILKVCYYFVNGTPPYDYYIRELPIEVHSKFIEQHIDILKKLLNELLPPQKINITERDFAGRYFLRKPSVYTQIRILDDDLKPHLGYDDISLSIDDAAWLKWTPKNVFIIENQICYLTFPKVKHSVAIFGEGFKSRLSKNLPWLGRTNLFCWFDLDAAGFEMLNMIRQNYPNAKPIFMNKETYLAFSKFAVEKEVKRKALPMLSDFENKTYDWIIEDHIRLEQEKITQKYVRENVSRFLQAE